MTELEGYKQEAQRCRDEEHKTKVAAQEMQRKLLARVEELEHSNRSLLGEKTALAGQLRALSTKERGWPWALEQLAAGHKVTHPILSSDPERPGWIEKLGTGPRGTLYEIHESYTYMRVMDSEDAWGSMANKARQSIGWAVLK